MNAVSGERKCFECWRASLSRHEREALDSDIAREGMGTVGYCGEHRRATERMFAKFGEGIAVMPPGVSGGGGEA